MKESELKTGMRAVMRDGEIFIVMSGEVKNTETKLLITNYQTQLAVLYDVLTDDLRDKGGREAFDIVKVYDIPDNPSNLLNFNYLGKLLWERKEEKPFLTLDGVEYSKSTLRSLIKKATK